MLNRVETSVGKSRSQNKCHKEHGIQTEGVLQHSVLEDVYFNDLEAFDVKHI